MAIRHIAFTLCVVPFAACGDDGDDTQKTVTYSGTLLEGGPGDPAPVAGAEICFVSHPELDCVTTGADGSYEIGVPANEKVEVEVKKDGYIPIAANFITRDTDLELSAFMFKPEIVQAGFDLVDAEFDLSKGGLLVRVYDPANGTTGGVAGVTVNVSPDEGEGPFYADGAAFNPALVATSAGGNAIFGSLETKSYTVTFTSETQNCLGTYLWKASGGGLEAKVKAGFATYMYVDCPAI